MLYEDFILLNNQEQKDFLKTTDDITRAVLARAHNDFRLSKYPTVEDQLDMLWHAMDIDESKRLEPFYSTIKAIKNAYPKVE